MFSLRREKFSQKKAFTLSEVLISLVIIGIIAAITVPSVMQNTQKKEHVAKLKKAHSVLSQSIYRISMKSGYPVGDFSDFEEYDFFRRFIAEVNTIKVCEKNQKGCFIDAKMKYLNGTDEANYSNDFSCITADGITYGIRLTKDNASYCSSSAKGISSEDAEKCLGRFLVDLNGPKKPNRFGIDVFFFAIVDGKGIVPAGSNNSSSCRRGDHGVTCAAKVLKEDAINY